MSSIFMFIVGLMWRCNINIIENDPSYLKRNLLYLRWHRYLLIGEKATDAEGVEIILF